MNITNKEEFKNKIKMYLDPEVKNGVVDAIMNYYENFELPENADSSEHPSEQVIQNFLVNKIKQWFEKYQEEADRFLQTEAVKKAAETCLFNMFAFYNGLKIRVNQLPKDFNIAALKILWGENGKNLDPSEIKSFASELGNIYNKSDARTKQEILTLIINSSEKLIPEMAGHKEILTRIVVYGTAIASEGEKFVSAARLAFNHSGNESPVLPLEVLLVLWGKNENGKDIANIEGFIFQLANAYAYALNQSKPKQIVKVIDLINDISNEKERLSPETSAFLCMLQAFDQREKGNNIKAINYMAQGFRQVGEDKEILKKFNQKLEDFSIEKYFKIDELLTQVCMPIDASTNPEIKLENMAIVKALFTVPVFWNQLEENKANFAQIEIMLANYGEVKINNKYLIVYALEAIADEGIYQTILDNIPVYIAQTNRDKIIKEEEFLSYAIQVYKDTDFIERLLDNEKIEKILELVENDKAFAAVLASEDVIKKLGIKLSIALAKYYHEKEEIKDKDKTHRMPIIKLLAKISEQFPEAYSSFNLDELKTIHRIAGPIETELGLKNRVAILLAIFSKSSSEELNKFIDDKRNPVTDEDLKDIELNKIFKEKSPDFYNKRFSEIIAFTIVPPIYSNNPADEPFRIAVAEQYKQIDNNNLENLLKNEKISKKDVVHRQAILRAMVSNAEENDILIINILNNLPEYYLLSVNVLNDSILSKMISEKFPEYYEKLAEKETKLKIVPHVEELTTKFENEIENKETEKEAREKTDQTAFVEFTHAALDKMSITDLKEILKNNKSEESLAYRLNIVELILSKDQTIQSIQEIINNSEKYHLSIKNIVSHAASVKTATIEQLKIIALTNVNEAMEGCSKLSIKESEEKNKLVQVILSKDVMDKANVEYDFPEEKLSDAILEAELRISLSGQKDNLIVSDQEDFKGGLFSEISPFMRAVALSKWLTELDLLSEDLLNICLDSKNTDILNAIKINTKLYSGFLISLAHADQANETVHKTLIELLKCKYPTCEYPLKERLFAEKILKNLSEGDIKEILKSCPDHVRKIIFDNSIPYHAEKSSKFSTEFRLELLKQFASEISKNFDEQSLEEKNNRLLKLTDYINSYKTIDLKEEYNYKMFIPILRDFFSQNFMKEWELFYKNIDQNILDVLIDSCTSNMDKEYFKKVNNIPDNISEEDFEKIDKEYREASEKILDNIVHYAFNSKDFDKSAENLIRLVRNKLTGSLRNKFAAILADEVPKEGTIEDYLKTAVNLRNILEKPRCVIELNKKGQLSKAFKDYERISKFLMAIEYREVKKIIEKYQDEIDDINAQIKAIDAQLKENTPMDGEALELQPMAMGKSKKELIEEKEKLKAELTEHEKWLEYFSGQAKSIRSYRAVWQTSAMAHNLNDNLENDKTISEADKHEIKEIIKPYLSQEINQSRQYGLFGSVINFILGKPKGDLEEADEFVFFQYLRDKYGKSELEREMEIPVRIAKENEEIYDVDGNKLGYIAEDGQIYVSDNEFIQWKDKQKAESTQIFNYRISHIDEYKSIMIAEIKSLANEELEKLNQTEYKIRESQIEAQCNQKINAITNQDVLDRINREYQNQLKAIDSLTVPSLLQIGKIKIGTKLYGNDKDKNKNYLGTLNAHNKIELEIILNSARAQDLLLDEKHFSTMDNTTSGQLLKRVIETEGLSDFISQAWSNTQLFERFVQYLIEVKPRLKAIDWKNIVRFASEKQIDAIYRAYKPSVFEKILQGNEVRKEDRQDLLFALLSDSVKLDDFNSTYIVNMIKDLSLSHDKMNEWIDSDIISYRGRNYLRAYLLSDAEYVAKIIGRTHKEIFILSPNGQPTNKDRFYIKVKNNIVSIYMCDINDNWITKQLDKESSKKAIKLLPENGISTREPDLMKLLSSEISDLSLIKNIQERGSRRFKSEVASLNLEVLSVDLIKTLHKDVRIQLIVSGNFKTKYYEFLSHDFSADEKNNTMIAFVKSMEAKDAVVWAMKEIGKLTNRTFYKDYTKSIIKALLSRPTCVKILANIANANDVKDKNSIQKIQNLLKKMTELDMVKNNIPDLMNFIGDNDANGDFLKECFQALGQGEYETTSRGRKNAVLELSHFLKLQHTGKRNNDKENDNPLQAVGQALGISKIGYLNDNQKAISIAAGAEAGGPGRPFLQRISGRSHHYVAKVESETQRAERIELRNKKRAAIIEKELDPKKDTRVLKVSTKDPFILSVQRDINVHISRYRAECYVPALKALVDKIKQISKDAGKDTKRYNDLVAESKKRELTKEEEAEKEILYQKIVGYAHERANLTEDVKSAEALSAWTVLILKNESMLSPEMKKLKNVISPEAMQKYHFDPEIDMLNIANLIELAAMLDSPLAAEAGLLKADLDDLRIRVAHSMEKRINLYKAKKHTDLFYNFLDEVFSEPRYKELKALLGPSYKMSLPERALSYGQSELLYDSVIGSKLPDHVKKMINMFNVDENDQPKPVLHANQKPKTYMINYVKKHLNVEIDLIMPAAPANIITPVTTLFPEETMTEKEIPLRIQPSSSMQVSNSTPASIVFSVKNTSNLPQPERFEFDSSDGLNDINSDNVINHEKKLKKEFDTSTGKKIIFVYPANSETAAVPPAERNVNALAAKGLISGGLGKVFESSKGIHTHGIPTNIKQGVNDKFASEAEILHYISQLYTYAAQGHLVVLPYHPGNVGVDGRYAFGGGIAPDFLKKPQSKTLQRELAAFEDFIENYNKDNSKQLRPKNSLFAKAFQAGLDDPDKELFKPYTASAMEKSEELSSKISVKNSFNNNPNV